MVCKFNAHTMTYEEVKSKVYNDKDLYEVTCKECGAVQQVLANRIAEAVLFCKREEYK